MTLEQAQIATNDRKLVQAAQAGIDTSDHKLVQAAQAGSAQSFEILVERYYGRIMAYLSYQTQDRELAADLAQETFVDAFLHIDKLPEDRPFAAWLFRIARNNMLGAVKRQSIRRFISLDWLLRRADLELSIVAFSTVASDERALIQQVLNSLSPSLREALVLHSMIGFSGNEISEILEISPAAARQRICRAKEEFRLKYEKWNGVDHDASVWVSDG